MVEIEKVLEAFGTDEGTTLIADYSKLVLKAEHPDNVDDENYVKMVFLTLVEKFSETMTVPEGVDSERYLLDELKNLIKATESLYAKKETEAEDIPPRPQPNGSRYLNPAEVEWLIKYDPDVKESAECYAKWFRKTYPDKCSYMKDDMIVETTLETLYKLNRRDPEIVSQLSGAGPSFFKPYEEGTPEEIVTNYFDSSSGRKKGASKSKSKADTSSSRSSAATYSSTSDYSDTDYNSSYKSSQNDTSYKAQLVKKKNNQTILAVIFLFVFWPVGLYFFYRASRTQKEIDSL